MTLRSFGVWTVAAWGVAGVLGLSVRAHALPDKSRPKPVVFVEKLVAGQLYDVLTYPARLIPKVNASILSETDGVVREIAAPLGTTVKRGQKLMSVMNTDPVFNYAPVLVRASVAGVVSAVDVTEGSRVTRGQRLAQITDPSDVRVVVEVAVSDVGALKKGMKGELEAAGSEEPFPVEVVGVSPYVDPGTGTATAELRLVREKKSTPLPPGLVGKVRFRVREHEGFQVPESAVVYKGRDPHVRVIRDGKAFFQPVELGPTRRGMVEIDGGLKPGMTLVMRASTYIGDGEAVEIQSAEQPRGRE